MKRTYNSSLPPYAKEHSKHPLMMTSTNYHNVWLNTGVKLTVHKGPKGNYVVYKGKNGPVFVNVSKLYKEIFTHTGQVVYSKGQLRNQNRAGRYEAPLKVGEPIISMSGYILRGKNMGKKLSELSVNTLLWYVNNSKLNANELETLTKEIERRESK